MQIKKPLQEHILSLLSKYKRNLRAPRRHLRLSNKDLYIIIYTLVKSNKYDMLSRASKTWFYGIVGQTQDYPREIHESFVPLVCSDFSRLKEEEAEQILAPLLISISDSMLIDIWISIYQELTNKRPAHWLYSAIEILYNFIGLKTVFEHENADRFPKSECAKIFLFSGASEAYRRKSWWAIFSRDLDRPDLPETSWMTFDPALMADPLYVRQIETMILTDEETKVEIQRLLQIKEMPLFMPLRKNGEPKYRRIPEDLRELLEESPPQRRTIVKK